MPGSNLENNGSNQFGSQSEVSSPSLDNTNRGFGGPMHSPHTPHTPHTPGSAAPHTPVDLNKSGNKNSAQSSPANTNLNDMGMGPPRIVPASPNTKADTSPTSKEMQQHQQQQQQQQSNMSAMSLQNAVSTASQSNMSSGIPSTQMNVSTISQTNIQTGIPTSMNMSMANSSQQNLGQTVQSSHMNVTGAMSSMIGPGGNPHFVCSRPSVNVSQSNDNVPLNPNNIGNRLGPLGPMSTLNFDPISKLTQMSQQLSNNVNNNAALNNGSPPMNTSNNQGMMPFNQPGPPNMHMIQQQMQQQNEMNGCHMGAGGGPTSNELSDALGLGIGGPATSYSPTPHTGSPGLPNKMGPMTQMGMAPHGMMGGPTGPNVNVTQGGGYPSGPSPGMMGGPNHPQQHSHGPYNGANVQVKPSAPNTIQYLPARPNVGHQPRPSPNLDFLRFTNSTGGLDNKMGSPPVNLQYFPNGCLPQGSQPGMGGVPGPGSAGPGVMGGHMQGMHPSMRGQVRQQPSLMRMQHMVGGGPVFANNPMDSDKVFPPDMMGPGGQPGSPVSGIYGGPKPQPNAMGQLGPPPDTTQPLPPSMGGNSGPGPNFKNSPFMGPDMSNPNYAQQYHNFQQQLYATGRGAGGGPQQGPGSAPGHPGNMHAQPQFFMPK